MNNIIFKTVLMKGAQGARGEQGISDSVPTNGIIEYDGNVVPEGYVEIQESEVLGDLYEAIAFTNERLDNIIANPITEEATIEEVVDARLGYNGEVYTSLGNAIRDQVADVNDVLGKYAIKANASGEVATFTDGGDDLPLNKCLVDINAIQEGSGDPSPSNVRPIVGFNDINVSVTGFNRWDEVWDNGDIDATTGENKPSAANYVRSQNYIRVEPNATYYFKAPYACYIYKYNAEGSYLGYAGPYDNITFEIDADTNFIRFVVPIDYGTTYNHDICINISKPTGTPKNGDYVPYNGKVYPVTVGNKNLIPLTIDALKEINNHDGTWENVTGTTNWNYTENGVVFTCYADSDGMISKIVVNGTPLARGYNSKIILWKPPAGYYDVILNGTTQAPTRASDGAYNFALSIGAPLSGTIQTTTDDKPAQFTSAGGGSPLVCIAIYGGRTSPSIDPYTANNLEFYPMIRENGNSTFAPYHDNMGGTVYGGSVDVVTGELTVAYITKALKDLPRAGFTNGSYSSCYMASLSDVSTTVAGNKTHGALSSMGIEQVSYWGASRPGEEYTENAPFFAISPSGTYLTVYDNDRTITESDFLTKYNDFEVCYPIAEPITYQLTPVEVKSLLGYNNIFADSGDIDVTYKRDATTIINEILARLAALEG